MNDERDPRNKRYNHGGDAGLLVGQYILPPDVTGKESIAVASPRLETASPCPRKSHGSIGNRPRFDAGSNALSTATPKE
jgi:hypothetical protein